MKLSFTLEPESKSLVPDLESKRLLKTLREYLVRSGVNDDFYGINNVPPGLQDGCGLMLHQQPQSGLWVVSQVVRYQKYYPSFFTCVYDAIDFFVSEIPGMTKGLDLRSKE